MDQDTLIAKQQAVIEAAKALFSNTGANNPCEASAVAVKRHDALYGAVRELEKMENYYNGHPLTNDPIEVYHCGACDANSLVVGEIDDNDGVSHARCGQCGETDITWYVAVQCHDHHQVDTAKHALLKAKG